MSWADIEPLPWQETMWQRTQDSLCAGKLGHALLLCGTAGVGKRRFARRLAASLLCEARPADGQACGACRGCIQFAAGTHPNLTWLSREFNDKTDKEKRDISLEQLREMMESLALSSHYGLARVIVIDPADAMNIGGVNAVLKTVEEPPAGCYLLLITERVMALAPTLRSRCQRLQFGLPDAAVAQAWLAQQPGQFDAAAALAEAQGAPLAALEDQQSGLATQRRAWFDTLLALAQRRTDPLSAAAQVDKERVAMWLAVFQRALQRVLRADSGIETEAAWRALAVNLGALQVERLLAEAIESRRKLQSNANPQLLVESLMILWWHLSAPADSRTDQKRTSNA